MGEVIRLEIKTVRDTSLTNRMRALCAAHDHPHPDTRELERLNEMQEVLDLLYEAEYARRKERC